MKMNDIKNLEARYPEKDYKKMTFNFNKEELMRLISLDNTVRMAQLADKMMQTIINGVCIPRVGIKNSPDIGVIYDLAEGVFYVYMPRVKTEKKPLQS